MCKIFGKSFQGVYPEAPDLFLRAMDLMNITEKNVLVIGTQIPWLEAILHFRNPKLGVTVDFKSRERYKILILFFKILHHDIFAAKFLTGDSSVPLSSDGRPWLGL